MNAYFEARFGLKGSKALVTGAGKGIGRAIVHSLAEAGSDVAIHYLNSEKEAVAIAGELEHLGAKILLLRADLTKTNEVRGMFDKITSSWGGLDILVNNAGDLVQRSKLVSMSDELIDAIINVNLKSMVFCTRQAIPLMESSKRACVVNLSSVAAHHGGGNGSTMYGAAKAAVHTLTRGLAKELAPNIRVNAVAPGTILTDFHRKFTTSDALESMKANTPLGRLGVPDDIADAVVFLCGSGASFITGEVIEINGGLWLA